MKQEDLGKLLQVIELYYPGYEKLRVTERTVLFRHQNECYTAKALGPSILRHTTATTVWRFCQFKGLQFGRDQVRYLSKKKVSHLGESWAENADGTWKKWG